MKFRRDMFASSANSIAADLQPVLRWAGSKKRQLVKLLPFVPPSFNTYIEPFSGSACLYFALSPRRSLLNDLNARLMNFYKCARRFPEEVFDFANSLPRVESSYYEARRNLHAQTDPIKSAGYFFYLNRNCFNGIYRVNKRGDFNVPFAADRVPPYPARDAFARSMRKMRTTKLTSDDFEIICRKHAKPGDFVYLDPPYYHPSSRVFTEYTASDFTEVDFSRLRKLLVALNKRGVHFLLSYPDSALTRELKLEWASQSIEINRSVAASTAKRKRTTEVLLFNYELGR